MSRHSADHSSERHESATQGGDRTHHPHHEHSHHEHSHSHSEHGHHHHGHHHGPIDYSRAFTVGLIYSAVRVD